MTESYTIAITSNGDFIAGQGLPGKFGWNPEEMIKTWRVKDKKVFNAIHRYLNAANDWQRQWIFFYDQPWTQRINWPDEIKELLKSGE